MADASARRARKTALHTKGGSCMATLKQVIAKMPTGNLALTRKEIVQMANEIAGKRNERREATEARQQAFKRALGTVGSTEQKAKAWREYDAACDYEDEIDKVQPTK